MSTPRERQLIEPLAQRALPDSYIKALNDLAKVQTLGMSRAMSDLQRQLNTQALGVSRAMSDLQRQLNTQTLGTSRVMAEVDAQNLRFNQLASELNRWHSAGMGQLPSQKLINQLAASLPQVERITHAAVASALELNRSLETRARSAIDDSVVKSIASTHLDFSRSYAGLMRGLNEPIAESVRLRPALLTLPPIEHYNASCLMIEIFPPGDPDVVLDFVDESEDESSEVPVDSEYGIENLLSELDERLIVPWRGIEDSISSGGADRLRQSAASMRELLTQLVHQLAPDNEVRDWSTDPNHLHNGRPTRRARFLYICQNSDHGDFSKFLETDVDACLRMFDVFQTAVHSLESPFSERQILALRARAEGTIRILLETAKI